MLEKSEEVFREKEEVFFERETVFCDGTSMIYELGSFSHSFLLSDPNFENLKPGMWRMDKAVITLGREEAWKSGVDNIPDD